MKKIAVVDCRAGDKTVYSLEKAGVSVIPTIKVDQLYDAVATHADMQIYYSGNNCFVCAPEVYEHYKKLLPNECTLIKGSINIGSAYPEDICYNAAPTGKFVFCNSPYTAPEILNTDKTILNIKQGYAKCSICVIDENSIITADKGIAVSAQNNGIDSLLVTPGDVHLIGMSYGFIGGATGLIDKNILAVNGDINTHTNSDDIKEFCKKRGVELLQLSCGELEDIGTIITNI